MDPNTGDAHQSPAVLPFERREIDRWPLHGTLVCHEAAGADFGRRHVFRLIDGSEEAVGALVDEALLPGTTLVVSGLGASGPPRTAQVIRCVPVGDGYRVAVRIARRLAA